MDVVTCGLAATATTAAFVADFVTQSGCVAMRAAAVIRLEMSLPGVATS